MISKSDKAKAFTALHVKGSPILLYNVWDVGSAKAIVQAGAKAVATSNWAVAAALGYDSSAKIPRALVEEIAAGVIESVDVPVTVDFGSGYSGNDDELAKNVCRLLHVGAVGINFKDSVVNGSGLYNVHRQARRIAAIRRAAEREGVALFINARTDLFIGDKTDAVEAVDEAIVRAKAYADVGASGFFVPGLQSEAAIDRLCTEVSLPINVMRMDGVPTNDRLAELGVARISYGNAPYMRAMEAVQKEAEKALA